MNSTPAKPHLGRPTLAIGVALVVAALMIVAAWFKRSAPVGSVAVEVLEGTIFVLMTVGLFVPYLALPIGAAKKVRGRHDQ